MDKVNELKVSAHLLNNYKQYYEDGESKWRMLCAADKVENIKSVCASLKINSVVDIGAGEGSILKGLSDINFSKDLYALEISETGVETIKNKNISHLKECALFNGYNINYEDKKFDLAVLSHVIEHVEHPRKLLDEAKRVAKYVYIEVPLEDTFRQSQDFVFNSVGHINFYSPKTIRWLIQSCNLRVLNQVITNPSKSIYTFKMGKKGFFNYYLKEYILKIFPTIATSIFTYHSAIISEDAD